MSRAELRRLIGQASPNFPRRLVGPSLGSPSLVRGGRTDSSPTLVRPYELHGRGSPNGSPSEHATPPRVQRPPATAEIAVSIRDDSPSAGRGSPFGARHSVADKARRPSADELRLSVDSLKASGSPGSSFKSKLNKAAGGSSEGAPRSRSTWSLGEAD